VVERAAVVPDFVNEQSEFKKSQSRAKRWGVRVVEGDGLENRYTRNGIVSSNLTPTALLGEMRLRETSRRFESYRLRR
jgi:hypothetical protein